MSVRNRVYFSWSTLELELWHKVNGDVRHNNNLKKEKTQKLTIRSREEPVYISSCALSMTFSCTPRLTPTSHFLLFPLKTVALPSRTIFIQHLITIIKHKHGKKDKLKETAQPKTWIWEAYFHLSFLSSILLCCSFLFAQRNGKRHAFSSSLCLIMALFRPALLYGACPEPCTGIVEQPVDYPDSRQHFNRAGPAKRPCQV